VSSLCRTDWRRPGAWRCALTLPPAFLFDVATAPVQFLVRIVERIFNGFVGGLCSGLVSDLNVLVGNTEEPTKNLTDAWATNARTPSETE